MKPAHGVTTQSGDGALRECGVKGPRSCSSVQPEAPTGAHGSRRRFPGGTMGAYTTCAMCSVIRDSGMGFTWDLLTLVILSIQLVRLHWGPPSALRCRRWCGLGGVSIVTTRYWCISTTPSGQNLGSRLAVGNYLSPIASNPKPWKQTAGRRCKQTASRGIAILPPTGSTKTKVCFDPLQTHALCTYSTESWSSGNFDS
jgi:hypothetical protein